HRDSPPALTQVGRIVICQDLAHVKPATYFLRAVLRACFENHAGLLATRRPMSRRLASCHTVARVGRVRSSSWLRRRCRPSPPSVRSPLQPQGLTTHPWTWGVGGMLSHRPAPSVAPHVARGSPL